MNHSVLTAMSLTATNLSPTSKRPSTCAAPPSMIDLSDIDAIITRYMLVADATGDTEPKTLITLHQFDFHQSHSTGWPSSPHTLKENTPFVTEDKNYQANNDTRLEINDNYNLLPFTAITKCIVCMCHLLFIKMEQISGGNGDFPRSCVSDLTVQLGM